MTDVLVLLAALSIVAALAYPTWAARAFRQRVEEAVSEVDAAAGRARSTLESLGRWPAAAPAGQAPPELTGHEFSRETYALEWTTWEVVDSVEAPREVAPTIPGEAPPASVAPAFEPVARVVGAIAVHSADASLLAELLDRYGPTESFVLDTTWFGLLPERAPTR
ncbi:MAG: hypothetical protein WEB90_02655 [Gemmatimonadota bacterium]